MLANYLKFLLVGVLLPMALLCNAQETVPPFRIRLSRKQPDSLRIGALYDFGRFYLAHHELQGRVDSAEFYLKKALALATAAHRQVEVNRCNFQLANVYLERDDLATAEAYCKIVAAVHSANKSTEKHAQVWLKFGNNIFDRLTDTGKKTSVKAAKLADAYFKRGERIIENAKDSVLLFDKKFFLIGFFEHYGYDSFYRERVEDIIKKFDGSRFKQLNSWYCSLSQRYREAGNNNMSLFYLTKALKRLDRTRDTVNYHVVYGELALIYDELGQIDKSIEMYQKTLALREKMPAISQVDLYRTAGFLAADLNKRGRSAEGLRYINSLEAKRPPKDDDTRGMAAQVKAYCYDGLKRYDLAEKYYLLMLTYYKNAQLTFLKYYGLYDIADLYVRQNRFNNAEPYLRKIATVPFEISRIKNVELMLFKVDSAAGDPFLAIKHYQRYKQLNDSMFNVAKSGQIEELQIKYAIDQKESDLASVKKDRQLQVEIAKHATNARNYTLVGLGLLLIVIGLLYKTYLINKKKTAEIDRKNQQLNELLNEKDELLDEKEWLIKEVHHRVKNSLQIVMGLLQRQSSFIENEEALVAIQNSEHRLHSIALIHQKLYQSDNFALVNMPDYIDEMTTYLRDSFELGERITFEKQIDDIDLEINMAVPLSLILNEAITNAIKYAFPADGTGCINITLEQTGEFDYELQIADNGRGLPADLELSKIRSMGFNLMRGLSKQVGGSFAISNDGGVTVKVSFRADHHDA